MRLGLLGLGRIGAFHAQTLTSLPVVEELVAADPVPTLPGEAAERFGAQIADSPEAMLASGVDGVVIAAPTGIHPELIGLCVRAGMPAFCEQPVARDSDEAARLARQVAYLAASGGIFRDCSVHDFDAIRWVTGQEVTEAYAAGSPTIGRTRRVVPRRQAIHILHGPVRRRVPRGADGLHPRSSRPAHLAVHGRGRTGNRLGRRSLHSVARRAPPSPGRRSRDPMISGPPAPCRSDGPARLALSSVRPARPVSLTRTL